MALYLDGGVDSTPISGHFLAYNRHDRVAHAFYGADLVLSKTRLEKPTILQAAELCRVNPTYVHWAIKRQAERAEIEAGHMPLVPAAPVHADGNGNGTASVVPDVGIDDALKHIATLVGADRMLAAAIAAGH
jgi:hypothetical protein